MPDTNLNVNIKTNTDLNSLREFNRAIKEQKDIIIELRNKYGDLSPEVKKAEQSLKDLQTKLIDTKEHLKDVGVTSKMSGQQLLEMGENITVLVAGISASISKIIDFGKEIGEMALKGAEVTNMREHFDKMNGGITEATEKFEGLKKASSGNLDDKEILMYINKMDELNYTTEQSTQFLDIATTKHHELGLNIDEVNSKLLRFLQTGATRGLVQLGMSAGDVSNKIKEMTGFTMAQVKAMDSETATRIRSEAVLSLYGKSIDEINSKEKNTADVLKSVTVAFENAKIKIGEFIAGTIGKLAEAFGLTSEKMAMVITIAGLAVGSIMAITAAVIGLTIAFSALNVVSGGILIALGLIVTAAATFGAIKMSGGAKGSIDEYSKLAVETKNLKTEINSLSESYDVLNQTMPLNKEKADELTNTKTELIKKYPELISNITAEDSALDVNKEKLQQLINVKKDMLQLKIQEMNLKAEVTIAENYEKYAGAVKDTFEAEYALNNLDKERANILQQVSENEKIAKNTGQDRSGTIKELKDRLKEINEEEIKHFKTVQEGRATILQVNDAYKTLIQSNINAGLSIGEIATSFQKAGGTAKDFGTLLASVGMEALKGVNIAKEHQVEYAKWYMNYVLFLKEAQDTIMNFGTGEYGDKVANSMAIEMQRRLAMIEGWKAKTNTGGTTNLKKGKDNSDTEKDIDLNKTIIDQIFAEIEAKKILHQLTIQFLEEEKQKIQDKYDISVKDYELANSNYLANPNDPTSQKNFQDAVKHLREWQGAIDNIDKDMKELWKSKLYDKDKIFASDIKIDDTRTAPNRNLKEYAGGTPTNYWKMVSEEGMNFANSMGSAFSSIQNTFHLQNSKIFSAIIDNVNQILGVVNVIKGILDTIQTAKSFMSYLGTALSFIPGASAVGGVATGGISGGGMLHNIPNFNNTSSLNNMQRQPNITVVVNSEVETSKAIKFFDNNFNKYQNYRKSNNF